MLNLNCDVQFINGLSKGRVTKMLSIHLTLDENQDVVLVSAVFDVSGLLQDCWMHHKKGRAIYDPAFLWKLNSLSDYLFNLLRPTPAIPNNPVHRSSIVVGSGTGAVGRMVASLMVTATKSSKPSAMFGVV